jgi:uncharacterized HAD superfamily protein
MSIINIDIDGVLSRNMELACDYMREEFNITIEVEDITVYGQYIEQIDMDLGDVFDHLYDNNKEYLLKSEVIEGSVEAVNKLSQENKINIISHRDSVSSNDTVKWLDKKGFLYDEVYIGGDIDKHSIKGDIMIDDAPHVINNFKENNTDVIIFPRVYNKVLLEETTYPQNPVENLSSEELHNIIKQEKQWDYVLQAIDDKL